MKIAELANAGIIDFKKYGLSCTEETEKLIRRMVTYDPKQRITFSELFDHPYFN